MNWNTGTLILILLINLILIMPYFQDKRSNRVWRDPRTGTQSHIIDLLQRVILDVMYRRRINEGSGVVIINDICHIRMHGVTCLRIN